MVIKLKNNKIAGVLIIVLALVTAILLVIYSKQIAYAVTPVAEVALRLLL